MISDSKESPKPLKGGAEYCEKARHVKPLEDFRNLQYFCPRVWITFSKGGRLDDLSRHRDLDIKSIILNSAKKAAETIITMV